MGGTGGAGVISHPYIATQSRSCTLWNDSGERFHGRAYGFDKFAAEPVVFISSVCYGAVGTVDEILVGTFEVLTTMKVKQVYYPWETYRVSSDAMRGLLVPNKDPQKSQKSASM